MNSHEDKNDNFQQLMGLIFNNEFSKLYEPGCFIEKLELNELNKNLLLHHLCFLGVSKSVGFLIEKGANVNFRFFPDECENNIISTDLGGGMTPITQTIEGSEREENHTLETLQLLLKNGANPNQIGYSGLTPLQFSIVRNRPEHMAILLLNGADPWTPSADMDKPDAFEFSEDQEWARFMLQRFSKGRKSKDELNKLFPYIDIF